MTFRRCSDRGSGNRFIVALTCALSGCSGAGRIDVVGDRHAPIQTEQEAYKVTRSADADRVRVVAVYRNASADTTWISRCSDVPPKFRADRWEDGRWIVGYAPICQLIASVPVAVPPHTTRTDTLILENSVRPNVYRNFQGRDIPGTYRLVYDIHRSWTVAARTGRLGRLLPEEQRLSNAFRITE